MNKNIFFFSVLAAASAHADVEVAAGFKLYGTLDQAYTTQSVSSANATRKIYSNTGFFAAASTSKFGAKGERTLNENLKAIIQFEVELDPDSGSTKFKDDDGVERTTGGLISNKNRTGFVGLEHKKMGAVRMGTQETPAYVLFGSDANGRVEYKPQLWRFLAADAMQDRANNAIKLTSPKFGPVNVEFMRGFSEVNEGGSIVKSKDFMSLGLNYQEGPLTAKAVWDSLTNTDLKSALPGEPYAGVLSTTGTTQNKTKMISASTSKPLQRAFASVTYDMGMAKVNYIFGGAYTEGKGQVITNTFGIRVPMDQWTVALSTGMGNYTNAAGNSGTATIAGKLSDTTLGAFYSFDKSTTAYLLTSLGRHTPSTSSTSAKNGGDQGANEVFTSGVTGESQTTAVGLRYNY
jgi:predicted porin